MPAGPINKRNAIVTPIMGVLLLSGSFALFLYFYNG